MRLLTLVAYVKKLVHLSMIFCCYLSMVSFGYTQSLDDVVVTLIDPKYPHVKPVELTKMQTPWGTFKAEKKDIDGGWPFKVGKRQQYASVYFVDAEGEWLLNDFNVMIFAGERCRSIYNELLQGFQRKLGKPQALASGVQVSGAFWQLKYDMEWGVWLSTLYLPNPQTKREECVVKATLAFGADEYLSEDGHF